MTEEPTLLGVVSVSTSSTSSNNGDIFDDTVEQVDQSLVAVRTRLAELRDQRTAINREIKRLVSHEDVLARMVRIATASRREHTP